MDVEDVHDHYVRELLGIDPLQVRYADPEHARDLGWAAKVEIMGRVLGDWRHPAERGEAVVAQVVLRSDGDRCLTTEQVQAHCPARLAPFKVPKPFEVVESVPDSIIASCCGASCRGPQAQLTGGPAS